jgi:hypothetical protein
VDNLKMFCNPDTPEEIADEVSQQAQADIDKLDLEPEEITVFHASIDSRLEALGCGPGARLARAKSSVARTRAAAARAEAAQAKQPVLIVEPDPPDAVIYVDGEFIGIRPDPIALPAGDHFLRATYANCQPFELRFRLALRERKVLKPQVHCP